MAAGYIGAALFDPGIVFVGHPLDEFIGTGKYAGSPALFLGGVSLAGGSGSVVGTIIGVMIIGVLNNGLTLVGASEYVKMVLEGIALLLALCIEPISRAVMSARKK